MIGDTLYRLTEPALRPIRSILPNLGGIDISPVILILLLLFIRDVVLLGWLCADVHSAELELVAARPLILFRYDEAATA